MPSNAAGDLLVNGGTTPPYTEAVRAGGAWSTMTSSAVASLTAVPTTVAALEIWNNQQGVALAIDTIFALDVLGQITIPTTFSLWAQVTRPVPAGPSVTALTVASSSGRAPFTANAGAKVVTGVGTTVVASGWRPWGQPISWTIEAATPGFGYDVKINGRLLVPPQCSLCLQVTGSATGNTFNVGASWMEAAMTTSL